MINCLLKLNIEIFKYMYSCNTYMTTKTIRDVDERTWSRLRVLSAEHNVRLAKLLERMAADYEKRGSEFWKVVLGCERMLTDKEAEEMKAAAAALRKERGFR